MYILGRAYIPGNSLRDCKLHVCCCCVILCYLLCIHVLLMYTVPVCVCYLLCMHVLLICTVPGPVSFISVESVNSSSLNISWGAASPANGDITHYLVWVNSSSQHYQSNIRAPDMGVIEGRLGQLGPYQEVCPSTCVRFRRMSYRMLALPCVYIVASLVVPSEVVWPLHSLVAACRDFGHATETLFVVLCSQG